MSTLARQIIGEENEDLRRLARSGLGLPTRSLKVARPFLTRFHEFNDRAVYAYYDLHFSSHDTHPVFIQSTSGRVNRWFWKASINTIPPNLMASRATHWSLTFEIVHYFTSYDSPEEHGTVEEVRADGERFAGEVQKYMVMDKVVWYPPFDPGGALVGSK